MVSIADSLNDQCNNIIPRPCEVNRLYLFPITSNDHKDFQKFIELVVLSAEKT